MKIIGKLSQSFSERQREYSNIISHSLSLSIVVWFPQKPIVPKHPQTNGLRVDAGLYCAPFIVF
jgi:hypothetical protein